jgi:RNA polymerase sigma factor (sigma-70 family)
MADSVKDYLNEIARYPLLSTQQEIQLSRQIQAGMELADRPDLSVEEKRTVKRANKAKRTLMNCNLRLVVHLAKKYVHRLNGSGLEFMDLVQEGALGLHRAVELFDGAKGYKFSTYAYWWIRQAITRGIDTKERLIRVPQHCLDDVYKVIRFQKEYMQEHGKMPSLQQMADVAEIDTRQMEILLSRNTWHRSLDEQVVENGGTMLDLVADTVSADEQQEYVEKDEKAKMYDVAMQCLTESELEIIKLRYGIGNNTPTSMAEIAKRIGVSRERIRQRIEAAHLKMRLKLKSGMLI